MAEALSVAGSVAGIVGVCGQILQGCLFLKNFIEDARDAPEHIRLLVIELQVLSSSVIQTRDIFERTSPYMLGISVDAYEPALKQCFKLLSIVTTSVTVDSKNLRNEGRMKWWYKLSVSSRKKMLETMLNQLERAKSQINLVQNNVSLTLQHDHYLFTKGLHIPEHISQGSPVATASMADTIASSGEAYLTLPQTSAHEFTEAAVKFGTIDEHFRDLREAMATQIKAQSICNQSALEPFIKDAINSALQTNNGAPSQNLPDSNSPNSVPNEDFDASLISPQDSSTLPSLELASPISQMQRRPRRRGILLQQSSYRNFLVDIDIKVTQIPDCDQDDREDTTSYFLPLESRILTTIHVRSRLPFWSRGFIINSASSKGYDSIIGLNLTN